MLSSGHGVWRADDDAELNIYCARGSGDALPGLVVFPSIFSVTDELSQHIDEIAASGALALAFDPFSRCGDRSGPRREDQLGEAMTRIGDLDFARASLDFAGLIAAVARDDGCNGAVVGLGICLGGPFVMTAAADGLLAAAATWHGSRMSQFLDRAGDITCPFELDFGDQDPVVPADQLHAIRDAFAGRDNVRIRVHEGAGHGFSHTGWRGHREDACAAGREAVQRLLAQLRR